MPFGHKCTSSFPGAHVYLNKFVRVYLDDFLVLSFTLKGHMYHLYDIAILLRTVT